jgi:DNA-binding PadR family transcriptional regulator
MSSGDCAAMATNVKLPSGSELTILELLIEHVEMYPLEMVATSASLLRGSIYVTLGRMERKGLVASRHVKQANQSGNPKHLYRVTDHGLKAYEAWLQASAVFER